MQEETIASLLERIKAYLETQEIMHDEELLAIFRQGLEDIEANRVTAWEEVKKELGLE